MRPPYWKCMRGPVKTTNSTYTWGLTHVAINRTLQSPLLIGLRSTLGDWSKCVCESTMYIINKTLNFKPLRRGDKTHHGFKPWQPRASLILCLGTCLISDHHSASPPRKTVIPGQYQNFSCFARGYGIEYIQIMHHPTFFLPKLHFLLFLWPNTPRRVPYGQFSYTYTRHSDFGSKCAG